MCEWVDLVSMMQAVFDISECSGPVGSQARIQAGPSEGFGSQELIFYFNCTIFYFNCTFFKIYLVPSSQ